MAPNSAKLIGANPGRSRSHNRQMVLSHVRNAGRIGRAQIARSCGLSTQAVSNIIANLEEEGLLKVDGKRSEGPGLPVIEYALNAGGGYALGVEIRPDAVFAVLLNLVGDPVFSGRSPIDRATPKEVTAEVVRLRDLALKHAMVSADRLLGAGIVMPGPFGITGLSDHETDLPEWQEIDPTLWFNEALGVPVRVENDANAAAMAERINGAAQGFETYAFIYFGTGLGLGVLSHGMMMRGAFGNAGEIGHVIWKNGQTLEQSVSRLSVRAHMAEVGVQISSSNDLLVKYSEKNSALLDWLESAAEPLSYAVSLVENLFDPEAVILGGAMPDEIFDHLIASVSLPARSVANRPDRRTSRLLRGASGRMTATLGGAALVLNQVFTPMITVAES